MRTSVALVFCLILGSLGCSSSTSAPDMHVVHGTVTFDGKPIEKGRILFRQTEGDGRAYSTEIVEGAYELEVKEGPSEVTITASRLIPGKFDNSNGTPEQIGEMYIPAKYNRKTELNALVTPGGENQFAFDLMSK
ncbi:hypothetical protein Pan97_41670 [Bremerella volcania]|uniref:Carboxypeptidase regulatory-like domain-containing protein n=1 Tax=Bremerella volcania TaxID=2527984 RepID=A0A518CCZ9_9BACT|nr:hypothetical protein [Bremerella volcania]QDU77105.1 hypothetical protein Pan97_41670 [Bremerella volcania]